MAFSWFQSITRTTAADFRSPCSNDQRRFRQASRVTNTAHACAARFITDKRSLTRQTDSDFHYRYSLFPHGENTRLHTHTQTHSATAVTTYATFDFRDSSSVHSSLSSAPRYFPRPLKQLSFLLFDSVTNNSGVFRVTKFSANTTAQLLSHLADDSGKIKVPLSLSRPL